MKSKLYLFFLLFIFFAGCTKTITPVDPNVEISPNRLFITSFESDGKASLDNWVSPGPPIVKFSNDIPLNGGKFSIFLKARDLGAFVTKEVIAPEGNKNYKLSFWSKSTEDPGSLIIYRLNGSNRTVIKEQNISEKNWAEYTINFSLTSSKNDIILIELGGSDFASPQGYTFFDLIDLQIIK
ncbi:MAG: hypothetical protein CO128_05695 [Ignavibacteriales bacterium CG_4_9_14_3_um_filter_30_11]|nr:MAG: hypothetical protein CO128_05695 [Ignavibacteriales bacterium CG_4_9_14_3_um_filter_30_11]